ncbi:MAG: Crp/Fnr family transcriptional regulator [Deltaproteobacteria bacterium]|nr:Crp/Fnr family transcriptional regulator [Deltaproteobacteria bacterium]
MADAPDARALVIAVTDGQVDLADAELDAIVGSLKPCRYDPSDVIFRRDERCRELVIIASGLVRAYDVDDRGRDVNHRFLAAPNLATALTSLITGEPSEEWIDAVTPVVGFRGSVEVLEQIPRGDRILRIVAEQHYLSMERRMRMLQLRFAAERYRFYREHLDPAIVAGMPDFHVASYLGVSAETLSRARRRRS